MANPAGPPPTLRTLAAATGFSVSCVSYALRDHPSIPPATRDLIKHRAQQMGYRRAPAIAELMSRISQSRPVHFQSVLAVINPLTIAPITAAQPYHHAVRAGIAARATTLGYQAEDFWLREPGLKEARLSSILHTRGVRGVIFLPFPDPTARLVEKHWSGFAGVRLGYTQTTPRFHRVTANHHQGALLTLDRLSHLGYRRIGMVIDEVSDHRVRWQWTSAFLRYQEELPTRDRVPLFRPAHWNEPELVAWFSSVKPEAIVSNQPAVVQWLRDAGTRVPEDVGFAMPGGGHLARHFAGVDQDAQRVGSAAVDVLVGQIHRNEFGPVESPRTIVTEGRWFQGRTVRRVGPPRPFNAPLEA
jgi:LacI family transcriptional regulator